MAKKNSLNRKRQPIRKQWLVIAKPMAFKALMLLGFVVIIAMFVNCARQDATLPILHVTVDGELTKVNRQQLVKAVSPFASGGFFTVDVDQIRQAGESVLWVSQIQVKRIWPDTLHLVVEEQMAVAKWRDHWLVNKRGQLFRSEQADMPTDITQLNGPKNKHQLLIEQYQIMAPILAKQGLWIKQLAMNDRRAWQLILNDGMAVKLGRVNNAQRFQRFVNIYQTKLVQFQSLIDSVDMRYTNGLAVKWKPEMQPEFIGTV